MNGASAELGAIPAAARLWCPVALTAVSLYLRARLHGGEFLIPFVLLGGGLVGWVESRLLARRGHPWDSHRELSFLGGALGLWLSGVVETALLDETGRSHRWPDHRLRAAVLIDGGLSSALIFWSAMAASQWLGLRRRLRSAAFWLAANVTAGVLASASVGCLFNVRSVLTIPGLFLAVTASAMILAVAVTRLPVLPTPEM